MSLCSHIKTEKKFSIQTSKMKISKINLFTFCTFAVVSTFMFGSSASAEQCVYNQSGYVAKVRWYSPDDIKLTQDQGKNTYADLKDGNVRPIIEQVISLGKQTCINVPKPAIAGISVQGGKYARTAATVSIKTLVTAGVGVACAASAGTACPLVSAAAGATTNFIVNSTIPDAKETFYIDVVPNKDGRRRLILFGTVFDPKTRFGRVI